jgi:hypothetical protein
VGWEAQEVKDDTMALHLFMVSYWDPVSKISGDDYCIPLHCLDHIQSIPVLIYPQYL